MSNIRRNLISICSVIALLAMGLMVGRRFYAQEKPAPGPGPEMLRLQKFYLGTWEYTETYPKSSYAPQGGMNTGIYTSELGPGGNSLINRFHSKGPVGDFEGMLIVTWDAKEKAYKCYIFGNDFPGAIVETGNFEGDALVFRGEMTVGETKIAMRNNARVDGKGTMIVEEYSAMGGAPESLLVHVEAKRKP